MRKIFILLHLIVIFISICELRTFAFASTVNVLFVSENASSEDIDSAKEISSADENVKSKKSPVYSVIFAIVIFMLCYRALAINRRRPKNNSDLNYKRRSFVAKRKAFDENEDNDIIDLPEKTDGEG